MYGLLLLMGTVTLIMFWSVDSFKQAADMTPFLREQTETELWQMRRGLFNDGLLFVVTNLITALANQKIVRIVAKLFGTVHCLSLTVFGPMYGLWLSQQPEWKHQLNQQMFEEHITMNWIITAYSFIGLLWVTLQPITGFLKQIFDSPFLN